MRIFLSAIAALVMAASPLQAKLAKEPAKKTNTPPKTASQTKKAKPSKGSGKASKPVAKAKPAGKPVASKPAPKAAKATPMPVATAPVAPSLMSIDSDPVPAKPTPRLAAARPSGKGFLIRSVDKGSIYEKLGLRSGDMITTINGKPVTSGADTMVLINKVENAEPLALGVERNGVVETINYKFDYE